MRFLYDFLFLLFSFFYLPFFFIKGKHKGGFSERLGIVPSAARETLKGRPVFWLHAVSVGEVALAFRLAAVLKERFSDTKFLFTVTTVAGKEVAKKIATDDDVVLYFPLDFTFSVRRFIRTVAPKAVVILETEIWPNLIAELSEKSIPVYILNARISDKAMKKYRAVRFFLTRTLNRLTAVGAQDDAMRLRFIELGLDPNKVRVTGNIKYDWKPGSSSEKTVADIEKRLKGSGNFVCIAGSTHEGEEEKLFDVWVQIKKRFPLFTLLVAPRHMDRLDAIETVARKKNIRLIRTGSSENGEGIYLLDQMGILASLYRAADCVFVGGSLVPTGGHNLVEPAFFEKPVLFGPYMHNFKEMSAEFLRSAAAIQVNGAKELESEIISLIGDPQRRLALGRSAKKLVGKHEGAVERNVREFLSAIN